jgi:hypothetical protein
MGVLDIPLFFVTAASGLFPVRERERGAGKLQTGLREPQEHIGGGRHGHRRGNVRHGRLAIVIEL